MGTRETWVKKFKCPKCGAAGEASIEENATPPHHGGDFNEKVKFVTKGFSYKLHPSKDPQFTCERCNVLAV
jgi:transcription elongation factor Elf1